MGREESLLYEFGPFRLDLGERLLLRDGELVSLTPKAFDTLAVLVRHSGRVLEKEELIKAVWPDTFVEEATLAQNIFTLRKALGNGQNKYIETVPRRGYRFVAAVREIVVQPEPPAAQNSGRVSLQRAEAGEAPQAPAGSDAFPSPPAPERAAPRRAARTWVWWVAALAVLAGLGLYFIISKWAAGRTATVAPFQAMEITRLPIPGRAVEAALSPDGRWVVYAENEGGRHSLWVKQVAANSAAQQIVPPAEFHYRSLSFSRDGDYVYFVSFRPPDYAQLMKVPALGGATRKLIEMVSGPVAISYDDRRAAFRRFNADKEDVSLIIADLENGGERELARFAPPENFYLGAWSPDGERLVGAVHRPASGGNAAMLVEFNVADGSQRPLSEQRWLEIRDVAWLSDGSGVVMSAQERDLSPAQIWRVDTPGGAVHRVTNDLNSYEGISLARSSNALVTMQTDRLTNIWVVPGGDTARATPVASELGKYDGYYGVTWTPDGRIVYAAMSGETWDIWAMNADGTGQKQLTSGAGLNYGPAVSADGRYIVFVSNRGGGVFNVWRIDIDGGNPKQLTFGDGENFAHVTPDNRWVIYAQVGFSQPNTIWKVPINGGEPVAITHSASSWPTLSPDGRWVGCVYYGAGGGPAKLAVVSIDGGEPVKQFDLTPGFLANTVWHPDGRGICFLDASNGVPNVWVQPVDGGAARQITRFKSDGVSAYDWSAKGSLVCSRSSETTGAVLIRNFR